MTSHVHLIAGRSGKMNLEDIIRDIKKFTSTTIIRSIKAHQQESRKEWMLKLMKESGKRNNNNTHYQFWQQHNHPVELVTNEDMDKTLEYIHYNPVEAGIVLSPEEYLYSSAKNYAGMPDIMIEVKFIE